MPFWSDSQEVRFKLEGAITLAVTAETEPRQSIMNLNFLVVQVPSAYNAILGWSGLNALQAIVFTYYLLMKFSTPNETDEVHADQMIAW